MEAKGRGGKQKKGVVIKTSPLPYLPIYSLSMYIIYM